MKIFGARTIYRNLNENVYAKYLVIGYKNAGYMYIGMWYNCFLELAANGF